MSSPILLLLPVFARPYGGNRHAGFVLPGEAAKKANEVNPRL